MATEMTPEMLAQRFHEAYERLAPSFDYETRRESAKPWAEVPEQNRALMTTVCAELLPQVVAAGRRQAADDIRTTHDTWSQLGKLPQSYLDGVADAAGIVDRAPAEPVEEADRG